MKFNLTNNWIISSLSKLICTPLNVKITYGFKGIKIIKGAFLALDELTKYWKKMKMLEPWGYKHFWGNAFFRQRLFRIKVRVGWLVKFDLEIKDHFKVLNWNISRSLFFLIFLPKWVMTYFLLFESKKKLVHIFMRTWFRNANQYTLRKKNHLFLALNHLKNKKELVDHF